MAIVTRPDPNAPPVVTPEDSEAPAHMSAQLANALMTYAPLTLAEMRCMAAHFLALIKLLDVSGPVFSPDRRKAVDMYNRTVRRLNGVKDQLEAERRAALEMQTDPDRLLEIR